MKFKVGDRVKVRENLGEFELMSKVLIHENMAELAGQEVIISEVFEVVERYEINGNNWFWTDEMLEPIEDPLADKIEERNNKPEEEQAFTIKDNLGEQLKNMFEDDPIKPTHYRKGEIDLYESWYRTYPFNEFRAGMQMIAERYMKRDKDNRIQDLDKAMETLKRLKEYEEMEG